MKLCLINEATVEDVQRRIPIWIKNYFGGNESKANETIPNIISADPTKGKYSEWLIRQWKNKTARFPEDNEKLLRNLTLFEQKKSRLDNKDINAYTPGALAETLSQQFKATGSERRDARKGGLQLPTGSELIASKGYMKAVKITTPEAASILCSGTEWCVANKETAKEYLDQGPLYLIYIKDQRKYLVHKESDQFMDVYDNSIENYNEEDVISIKGLKIKVAIIDLLSQASDIKLDSSLAYNYATRVIKGRFPEGESNIAKNKNIAYLYAKNILFSRFPAAEPIIAKDGRLAYQYALNIIKGRWPEAEPDIAKSGYSAEYAEEVIKGRWPEAEPDIAKNPLMAYKYAVNVLKGRFPAGEPTIMSDSNLSKQYQSHVDWIKMMSEDE